MFGEKTKTKKCWKQEKKRKGIEFQLPVLENESENPGRGRLPLKTDLSLSAICFLSNLWTPLLPI